MKWLISIILTLSITCCFSQTTFKIVNSTVNDSTFTIRVIVTGFYPDTDDEFETALGILADSIIFKDPMDGISFWLFITVATHFNTGKNPKGVLKQLVSQMNSWFDRHY